MIAALKNTAATHMDPQPGVKSAAMAACTCPPAHGIDATGTIGGRDSYAVTSFADIIDRSLHATAARFTMGLSPAALSEAYLDWATHLAFSPGKRSPTRRDIPAVARATPRGGNERAL